MAASSEIQPYFDEFIQHFTKCQELLTKDDQDIEDDYEEYSERAIDSLRELVVALVRESLGDV